MSKGGGALKRTTHLLLVLKLIMSGNLLPLLLYEFMAWTRKTFSLLDFSGYRSDFKEKMS
jgi:hypothetical protein